MKVVINSCFGGFGLSPEAVLWLYEHGHDAGNFKIPVEEYFANSYNDECFGYKASLIRWKRYLIDPASYHDASPVVFTSDEKYVLTMTLVERRDPMLVKCVESLGVRASGAYAKLTVVEIPDDVKWHVNDHDGMEHIAEDHRTWP